MRPLMHVIAQDAARVAWLGLCLGLAGCATLRAADAVVVAPVANLRSQPGTFPSSYAHDPQQETQLIYGERVRIKQTQDGWARVEALEQPEFTHHRRWQGYPGWVPAEVLRPAMESPQPNAVVIAKWATMWRDANGTEPWMTVPMGTRLRIMDDHGHLWRVRAIGQHDGWIAMTSVRRHAALTNLSAADRRQAILRAAEQLIGDPYFWGGRSPTAGPMPGPVTGVDCSGLVNLAYRTVGVRIPRDAHEQFLRARKIVRPQVADLVFLAKPDAPRTITHVLLSMGEDWLIEGAGTGETVRRIEAVHRFGKPLAQITPGERVGEYIVYFGAYLR